MKNYSYSGCVSKKLIENAIDSLREYKADKEPLVSRIRDNERFYRASYSRTCDALNSHMVCDTPFIFSSIENARADAVDNFPSVNILAREPQGSHAAELLSKIVPAQLEISGFKRTFKDNVREKLKYGTAIYGVFYNDNTGDIDIKGVNILDVYVDMHISDIQESKFLFISAAVENSLLAKNYPDFAELFSGDAEVESISDGYRLRDRTTVVDCYYKTTDGHVHMMKLCKDRVIAATEDMHGYENGLYTHGMYPVVFDTLYPSEGCPFGFGMLDIAKTVQTEINKLDAAITENIMCSSKPRYLAKRSGAIDERELCDMSRHIVHYEGDPDSVKPIDTSDINEFFLTHREYKKDELKEILGNRDFQQGSTYGGVTAASAIETLRQTGEKRSRAMINDTYDSYRNIIYMMLELMRQFFEGERYFRIRDELGQEMFAEFNNSLMFTKMWEDRNIMHRPLAFDIDVVAQKESPYARESANNTLMSFWQGGMFEPGNTQAAIIALKNMNFDGKEKLIADLSRLEEREDTDVTKTD